MLNQVNAPIGQRAPIFIGRRPIFDKTMGVWGYSLRFWETGTQPVTDKDASAELRLLMDGINLIMPCIESPRRLILPISRTLLLQEFEKALPSGRIVFEMSQPVTPDFEVLKACQRLKRAGFQLMFGDYIRNADCRPLRAIADIVQIELPKPVDQLSAPLEGFNGHKLVSRVEDREILHYVWKLGFGNFSLFGGTFFSKPEIITGRRISAGQMARMRLMGELSRGDFSPARLAAILQGDAAVTLRLFNYANSADKGLRSKVTSIQHAVTIIGEVQTRSWLRVVLLTELAANAWTDELQLLSAQRARFLELVSSGARSAPLPPDSMHLVGLFSLLDSMLSIPLADILKNLPIDESIKTILADPANPWLQLLAAQERAQWDELELLIDRLGLDPQKVALNYTEAMEWALEVLDVKAA